MNWFSLTFRASVGDEAGPFNFTGVLRMVGKRGLKDRVLALRAGGASISDIVKELGCCRSSVVYWLDDGVRARVLARAKLNVKSRAWSKSEKGRAWQAAYVKRRYLEEPGFRARVLAASLAWQARRAAVKRAAK